MAILPIITFLHRDPHQHQHAGPPYFSHRGPTGVTAAQKVASSPQLSLQEVRSPGPRYTHTPGAVLSPQVAEGYDSSLSLVHGHVWTQAICRQVGGCGPGVVIEAVRAWKGRAPPEWLWAEPGAACPPTHSELTSFPAASAAATTPLSPSPLLTQIPHSRNSSGR